MAITVPNMNLDTLLPALWDDLHEVRVLWQVGVLVLALAAGWLGRRALPRSSDTQNLPEHWRMGAGGLRRVSAPLIALLLVLIGRAVLIKYQLSFSLLSLAVPLLVALALSRAVVYMLRLSFTHSTWLTVSERYIAWMIWLGLALHITGLAPDVMDWLDDIKLPLGKQHLSLLTLLQALIALAVALLVSLWLGRVTEQRLARAEHMNVTLRVMLTNVLRPLLVLLALLVALPAVGIDLTALSVFGGALGVGLGLGLQKIASNYVSGFIILLDRSVSIGSQLTVDGHTGKITGMTARYVVLRKGDGTEAILPNDTLVTSTVVNHSYSDTRVRAVLPVRIAYASDLEAAIRLMVAAAGAQPLASDDPPPVVQIKEFGDNGALLELGFWLDDLKSGKDDLISAVYLEIWRAFRAGGIEIAAPQRDIRLTSAPANVSEPLQTPR